MATLPMAGDTLDLSSHLCAGGGHLPQGEHYADSLTQRELWSRARESSRSGSLCQISKWFRQSRILNSGERVRGTDEGPNGCRNSRGPHQCDA